ncbi:MAG: hypothetical protein DRO88_09090 [Promethearchaeia archaeon]|nr:MAG: hypothetical protein DRO88_09090 [Candidatus Lokiarchaeia archaeon]
MLKSKKALKINHFLILLLYFLSPVVVSIIYWFEEPEPLVFTDSNLLMMNLLHRTGSVLGIFAFIWMCFNIFIAIKLPLIEKNFSLDKIIKFHTNMATLALFLSIIHYPLSRINRIVPTTLMKTGTIGFMIFLTLMILALIFMTNRFIKSNRIMSIREFSFEKNFKYNFNKTLHNFTLLGVSVIYIHAFISITSKSSMLMRIVYSFFVFITLFGWVYCKIIRKFRSISDPYVYRKASWDIINPEIIQEKDNNLASKLIQKNPSLYPCLQCGSCTANCIISEITKGEFNPREIINSLLVGLSDKIIIDKEPNIWDCTNCYSCDEICPQGVKLSDTFNFLRNRSAEQKKAPEEFLSELEMVYNFGVSIPLQSGIKKRRELLNLPPRPEIDIQEIQEMMEMSDFRKLFEKLCVEIKEENL